MSIMYGVFTIPMILVQWCIDPLYHFLILNGENIADADFCPVQIGFASLAAFCSFSVIYTFIVGKNSSNSETIHELERPMLPIQ